MMFHPALLDGECGVWGGGEALRGSAGGQSSEAVPLVLPLVYESFRASELLQERCVARLARNSMRRQQDLSYCTLEFFNTAGRKMAELKNLVGKAVRDPRQIGLKRAQAVRPAAGCQGASSGRISEASSAASRSRGTATEMFLRGLLARGWASRWKGSIRRWAITSGDQLGGAAGAGSRALESKLGVSALTDTVVRCDGRATVRSSCWSTTGLRCRGIAGWGSIGSQ